VHHCESAGLIRPLFDRLYGLGGQESVPRDDVGVNPSGTLHLNGRCKEGVRGTTGGRPRHAARKDSRHTKTRVKTLRQRQASRGEHQLQTPPNLRALTNKAKVKVKGSIHLKMNASEMDM